MDTTGSMGPHIYMAKEIAIGIVNAHQSLEYKLSSYILSPFNDPTNGLLTISLHPLNFTNKINKLIPYDGGDTPKLYYHRILDALKAVKDGNDLSLITGGGIMDGDPESLNTIQDCIESNILQTLTPIEISPTDFLSPIDVPNADFLLSAIALLRDGSRIQRKKKRLISPASISLNIDNQSYRVLLNSTVSMNSTLYNYGRTQLRMVLCVTNTMGFLSSDDIQNINNIAGMNHRSDTIELPIRMLNQTNSNLTMMTDSVLFSIAVPGFEYGETASVYIQQTEILLTNQTNYQVPSKDSCHMGDSCSEMIFEM
ncbi:unnamed protein product [Rotaria sp. Silwood1]|nr:unnamed protein product [Rotaria sp. Silwood1]CAF0903095.1 unnamed protein product [Rotaria sp. Silwood1]CAF3350423.1 unnamed protein product [Rotaria sp. Silwood1]CAF3378208.1 unnamed protein product [Rotaria sp. Silwood1]CAF4780231.1 unnamed protein product [Rotaria sp. Silwood1]